MNPENARIRWACRRGMLELDIFLLPFFDNCYLQLTCEEKAVFVDFLTATDPELFAWLMAHHLPDKKEFIAIVDKIRAYRLHDKN